MALLSNKSKNFHEPILLGGKDWAQKEKVSLIARDVVSQSKPFESGLEGMGAFPSLIKPRVIWVGASLECKASLLDLYGKVTHPLIAQGFPVEHESFTPHATLFRVRTDKLIQWDPEFFQFPETPLQIVDRLTLFKSTLTEWGSEYVPIDYYPFGK